MTYITSIHENSLIYVLFLTVTIRQNQLYTLKEPVKMSTYVFYDLLLV